jgi:hypothetical protein
VTTEQTGKEQGKGTVKSSNDFLIVDYDSGRDSIIIKDFAPPERFDIPSRDFWRR